VRLEDYDESDLAAAAAYECVVAVAWGIRPRWHAVIYLLADDWRAMPVAVLLTTSILGVMFLNDRNKAL
jgi:hypothetical protein